MNFAAVKFRIVFLATKWGAQSHLVNLKGICFFDIFCFNMNHLLSQFQKKSHPWSATNFQTAEVISEPLKVELAFDALAKKIGHKEKQEIQKYH